MIFEFVVAELPTGAWYDPSGEDESRSSWQSKRYYERCWGIFANSGNYGTQLPGLRLNDLNQPYLR